ncbi:MCE family protein [Nocardioides sp. LHG3406-4]|uniref:MCE family protein n=1 Tax=Nocardioides sp. LHG3406-4 TaxID=2804575 RepID=UPI003CF53701
MTPSRLGRPVRALLLLLAMVLATSACDFDVYKLPLPGGPDVGDDPLTVTVEFTDVLDLVPQSTVKVDDLSVGKVTDIELDGYAAKVTLQVRNDVKIPANATAQIRQTSLLGEKFVSLEPPAAGASSAPLESGDVIPIERTGRNPEVEEVLGALSLILNGGGVAQLKTITSELNLALEGREGSARSVLTQIRTLVTQLDDNKADIVDAIESLNRLALSVREEQPTIDAALDELPSALDSIDKQRADLVRMLEALDELSSVGVQVISQSKASTVNSLEQLAPVLTQFAASGDNFANAFNVFLTYPFVDEVVGRDPQVARNLHMGDYTNLSIQLDLDLLQVGDTTDLPTLPTNLPTILDPTIIIDNVLACLQSGSLLSPECQKVLNNLRDLTKLRDECQKPENQNKDVCKQLNAIPGLPSNGPLPPLPTLPIPTLGLPSLPGLPGLGRPPAGPQRPPGAGPTFGELMATYDPSLVRLLVPAMVTSPGRTASR